ncbi:MAG: class II aldolase/adducin family protein [Cyclobacteriaceae bacterium]|nr:class II aldolase/adducin family protein [Cyclobacteriaceae bacterium]
MNEGYIKFQAEWEKSPPLPLKFFRRLNAWRKKLYDLGLIGVYADGIGYGNISERFDKKGSFLITGSATGRFQDLTPSHYSLVSRVIFEENRLVCHGPAIASSESMSHAVIYRECPEISGVIHVHHKELWQYLIHKVPTTDRSAEYGTPEMARAISGLMQETDLRISKIFVMAGHEEGIFSLGKSLDEAGEILLQHFHQLTEGNNS